MTEKERLSAALFIDGSNFYHSLKEMKKLPFDAEQFKILFDAVSCQYDLVHIFFYDAIKSSDEDPEGYSKQQGFHARLKNIDSRLTIRTRKLKYIANITREQVQSAAQRIGIVDDCKDKLFDLLTELRLVRLTKEKGIDIQLVIDSIEEARCGDVKVVILLSGDADFVPAVAHIKTYGIRTVNLHLYYGSSTELRNVCDEHGLMIIYDDDIQIRIYANP